jgi:hypothetical protein
MTANDAAPIMDRIRKLLALATSTNAHEAALAAAKAQALMFQHNITTAQIDALARQDAHEAQYVREDIELQGAHRNSKNWRRLLIFNLARPNFCQAFSFPGTTRMAIVGQRHNIELITYLAAYLTREIERLAREGYRTLAWYDRDVPQRTWADGFCKGAVLAIGRRLRDQRQQDEEQAPDNSLALVVLEDQHVADAVKRYFPTLGRPVNLAGTRSCSAQQEGYRAGMQIQLRPGITAQQRPQLPA